MKPVGQANQSSYAPLYNSDGKIIAGGAAQLALGRSYSRSYLRIQNNSTGPMFVEFGAGSATCTLTAGAVSGVTIVNAGVNFTYPPVVTFLGGGTAGNSTFVGVGQPNYPSPGDWPSTGRMAKGIATISGGAITGVTILDGGSGYVIAPYVLLTNADIDPNGVAAAGSNVGLLLDPNDSLEWNGSCCPTDPIGIWGPTTNAAYALRWMD